MEKNNYQKLNFVHTWGSNINFIMIVMLIIVHGNSYICTQFHNNIIKKIMHKHHVNMTKVIQNLIWD